MATTVISCAETVLIGYIRVSSEEQLDSNSFPEQAREIEEWCAKRGYKLKAIYFDAVSGSKLSEREGLLASIQRAKTDENISGIVFFNFDRYFRDLGFSEIIRKTLQKFGKSIYSTQQDVNLQDKYGIFSFQVQQAVAELRRKEIVDLLFARRMAKVARGGWIGGRVPYGKKLEEGELVDFPTDRRNVRLIRRLRKWVHWGPGGRPVTGQWIAEYMNGKMQLFCPWPANSETKPYDKEVGIPLKPEYGPKHIQKNAKQRNRPYKRPKRGFWTRAMVQGILRDTPDVAKLFTREHERSKRDTGASFTTAPAQPFSERFRAC